MTREGGFVPSDKDRRGRGAPPPVPTAPTLDMPGGAPVAFAEAQAIDTALGRRVGDKGRALVRPSDSDSRAGFLADQIVSYRAQGGEFHPKLDYGHHELAEVLEDDTGVNFVAGSSIEANAVAAQRVGEFLGNPRNDGKNVVLVDMYGGTHTLRPAVEAAENGHTVEVREITVDDILAASTPAQARQIIAASAQAHYNRITGDKGAGTIDAFSTILGRAIEVLNRDEDGNPTDRRSWATPTLPQLKAAVNALHRWEINKLIEPKGPLKEHQVDALIEEWTPDKAGPYVNDSKLLLDYFEIIDTGPSTGPAYITRENEPADLTQDSRVTVLTVNNTGTAPSYLTADLVTAFIVVQAGDNREDRRPGMVHIAGAEMIATGDWDIMGEFFERHGVQFDTASDHSAIEDHYASMRGRIIFGRMPKPTTARHSAALGRSHTWGTTSTTASENSSHTEGSSRSVSRTRGSERSYTVGGGTVQGVLGLVVGGLFAESVNIGRQRSKTVTNDKSSQDTRGHDFAVQKGYVDRPFVSEDALRNIEQGEVLVVGNTPDTHRRVSLSPSAYYTQGEVVPGLDQALAVLYRPRRRPWELPRRKRRALPEPGDD